MSELKDIVPSLELCKMIPKGEFAESALVWAERQRIYGDSKPVVAIRSDVSFRANVDIIAPAPNPIEILASLPLGTSIWQDEPGVWVCVAHCGERDVMVEKADNQADAALRLWFKFKGIEVRS